MHENRFRHIDVMRGIAILFMIEVHTAATFQPSNVSIQHPFALLAAMIGGMAAPLFVTISGWGTHRSLKRRYIDKDGSIRNWILIRVVALLFCQWIVNIISFHLFNWHTPGVLSLLAISTVFYLCIIRASILIRLVLLSAVSLSPILIDHFFVTNLNWSERVASPNFVTWIERLFLTGTYPLFPWVSFFIFGGLISDISGKLRIRIGIILLIISTLILLFAIITNTTWALTSGQAILTFFPTSTSFVITAMTGVLIIHELLLLYDEFTEKTDQNSGFIHMGRLSLTIYVLHFIPFSLYEIFEIDYNLSMIQSFFIICIYTIIWWLLSIVHLKYCKNISLEYILKKYSR